MEQASLRTSRLSRNVAHDDSSPDSGLSALRSATAAYAALREELAEERQSNAALQRCAGSQFDPCVVDALLLAIDEVDAGIANIPVFNSGCGILPLVHSNPLAAARLDRG